MTQMTVIELVEAMKGKSLTYGWDAVTLYDQRKANELLLQHYIERFDTESGYIEPLAMVACWGDGDQKEHIHNLKLSAPRLSFEASSPELDPRARLTLKMIAGMIVSTNKFLGGPHYIKKILQVMPIGGPNLWMDQPLTKGNVDGLGDVIIDIDKADTFMANFVVGSLAQEDVGRRFKEYFDTLPPEQKKFSLGSIEGYASGVLTPNNFEIKVVKSHHLSVFGDDDYGDGAVMLFITLKDGKYGTAFPTNNSIYLLPSDECGLAYTGAMLLSSRVLFDIIMRDSAVADIGHGIEFLDYAPENGGGSDLAWSLKAEAGGISHEFIHNYKVRDKDFDAMFKTDLHVNFEADAGGPALTIRGRGESIEFVLETRYTLPFSRVIHWDWPSGDEWDYGDIIFTCNHTVSFDVTLDTTTGHVSFTRDESSSSFDLSLTGFENLFDLVWEGINIVSLIEAFYRPKLEGILQSLTTPLIDTFILRNLLFPGHNALHLSEAFVPGDLAVFGQIDPLRTATVLTPANSNIEAGSALQFYLTPSPNDVIWRVRDVDGISTEVGTINASGLYIPPTQAELPNGMVTVIVTAEGHINGQPVKSSALVSVLNNPISVNPLYVSCDANGTTELSAEAISGGSLEWTHLTPEWGSTLTEIAGKPNSRKYIAGGPTTADAPFFMDRFEVKKTQNGRVSTAYIHVLIIGQMVGAPMWLSEDSDPSSGSVQFEIRGKNGPIESDKVNWKMLGGVGQFDDETGFYTEPSVIAPGSFVVVSGTVPGDFSDTHAYATVSLPLVKYAELISAAEESDCPS